MTNYVLRSLLFVPGHREKLLRKAAETSADALILDMEDSVTPESNKILARHLCGKLLAEGLFRKQRVFIRLNDRDSRFLRDEVEYFSGLSIDGFLFPKAEEVEDIIFIDTLLRKMEQEKGLVASSLKLIPIIETCAALVHLEAICRSSRRIIALAFGCEDFITDLRGIHDSGGQSLFYPRAQIAITARANGIIPIDTVHVNVHDLAELEENLQLVKKLGFAGMLLLHPKEIELVHKYFTPSAEEIAEAQEILRLTELAEAQELGVAVFNNRFIGPPLYKAAVAVIRQHKIITEWEDSRV